MATVSSNHPQTVCYFIIIQTNLANLFMFEKYRNLPKTLNLRYIAKGLTTFNNELKKINIIENWGAIWKIWKSFFLGKPCFHIHSSGKGKILQKRGGGWKKENFKQTIYLLFLENKIIKWRKKFAKEVAKKMISDILYKDCSEWYNCRRTILKKFLFETVGLLV